MTEFDLTTVRLGAGAHTRREDGVCFNEAVAWFRGLPHSDAPPCVSPYVRAFGMRLNDRADDQQRQALVQFISRVVGTAGDGLDERRRWLAADHVIRTILPKWLDRAGMTEDSQRFRALSPISDRVAYEAVRSQIHAVHEAAWAWRRGWREEMRRAVREAVQYTAAAADAAADAADAAAAAVVDAAAADAADAAAAAVVDADGGGGGVYEAVYARMLAFYRDRSWIAEGWQDALDLYDRILSLAP